MPPELQAFAGGFPLMLLQAAAALLLLGLAASAFALLSPNREVQRVREGNAAAAVSFGGAIVGLALPIAASVIVSTSLVGLALWGVATSLLALLGFRLIDLLFTGLPQRLRDGDVGAAVLLVAARLAVAIVLAASLAV
jgi:putative membrane protein